MVLWFPNVSLIAMRASRLSPSMISVRLARVNWRGANGKGVDGYLILRRI